MPGVPGRSPAPQLAAGMASPFLPGNFQGQRAGYEYKQGERGLGYYRDGAAKSAGFVAEATTHTHASNPTGRPSTAPAAVGVPPAEAAPQQMAEEDLDDLD